MTLTNIILPIVRLRNKRGTQTIRPWHFQAINKAGPGAERKGTETQSLCAKCVDDVAKTLPCHSIGKSVAQVVGETTLGVRLLDVD